MGIPVSARGVGVISCSLGEVEAYARRAARGAGMSWGLAEEAGKAARWLATRGLPGVELLHDLLTANDGRAYAGMAPRIGDGPWRSADGDLCPICCGAALGDRIAALDAGAEVIIEGVAAPLLLAPFLDDPGNPDGAARELRVAAFRIAVSPRGLALLRGDEADLLVPRADEIRIAATTVVTREPSHPPRAVRALVDASVWRAVDDLGRRTYVPASEQSRARGAGAGLIDND